MTNKKNANKELFILISTVLFICIILFSILQFFDYNRVYPIRIAKIDTENIVNWKIEEVIFSEDYISLIGWALIKGDEVRSFDTSIVLKNINSYEAFEIPTVLVVRGDLNDIFTDEKDYSNNGFYSKVNRNLIDIDNNSFKIYIKYFNNHYELYVNTNMILEDNFFNE